MREVDGQAARLLAGKEMRVTMSDKMKSEEEEIGVES